MVCNSVMKNMYGNLNTKMIKHLDMKRRDMIQRELSQLIRERREVRAYFLSNISAPDAFGTQLLVGKFDYIGD